MPDSPAAARFGIANREEARGCRPTIPRTRNDRTSNNRASAWQVCVVDFLTRVIPGQRDVARQRGAEDAPRSYCDFYRPEIFNTDQGVQLTAWAFTDRLEAAEVQVSMDGRGRCLDNVFVQRLWRTVKYEDIYLYGYASVLELQRGLARYFPFYNEERVHQALDYRTESSKGLPFVGLDNGVHPRWHAPLRACTG
jgi:transposase InsO family protein